MPAEVIWCPPYLFSELELDMDIPEFPKGRMSDEGCFYAGDKVWNPKDFSMDVALLR